MSPKSPTASLAHLKECVLLFRRSFCRFLKEFSSVDTLLFLRLSCRCFIVPTSTQRQDCGFDTTQMQMTHRHTTDALAPVGHNIPHELEKESRKVKLQFLATFYVPFSRAFCAFLISSFINSKRSILAGSNRAPRWCALSMRLFNAYIVLPIDESKARDAC